MICFKSIEIISKIVNSCVQKKLLACFLDMVKTVCIWHCWF